MLAARQQQGVDQSLARHQDLARAFELSVEKTQVERGVVSDQRSVADERQQIISDVAKSG